MSRMSVLIRISRRAGWLLLPVMVAYLATGFALMQQSGAFRAAARQIHILITPVFAVLLTLHVAVFVWLKIRG